MSLSDVTLPTWQRGRTGASLPAKVSSWNAVTEGEAVVIDGCIDLLDGATDVDPTLIYALAVRRRSGR